MIRRRYLLRFLVILACVVVGFTYLVQSAPDFIGGFKLVVDSAHMFDEAVTRRISKTTPPPAPGILIEEVIFNSPENLTKMKTREFKGKSEYKIVSDEVYGNVLSASSSGASSMLYFPIDVNVSEDKPVLSWDWKVFAFPTGKTNATLGAKDDNDYAIRVYAMFKGGSIFSSDVIQYVWDDHFSEGSTGSSPYAANVKLLVIQKGPAAGNVQGWVHEERNITNDYRMLFGRDADKPFAAIGVMSDSDNTRSRSEAWIRNLSVSSLPQTLNTAPTTPPKAPEVPPAPEAPVSNP